VIAVEFHCDMTLQPALCGVWMDSSLLVVSYLVNSV